MVRYGGDEFLCALAGATSDEASLRVQEIDAALAEGPVPASVSLGISEPRSDYTLPDLIERADRNLHRQRRDALSGQSPRFVDATRRAAARRVSAVNQSGPGVGRAQIGS